MGDCIVDSCVLHGASQSGAADATSCVKTLDTIRVKKHSVVVSRELWDEWQEHLSKYSAIWQSEMFSRGQIVFAEPSNHHFFELKNAAASLRADLQTIAIKDLHVLSLAVSANAIVISCEVACRRIFVTLGRIYQPVAGVYWVSPLACDELQSWLSAPSAPLLAWLLV